MKKHLITLKFFFSAMLLSSFLLTACVDESYDLSKDVDLTIGVGKGLSIPVGSTDKIMLTELLDSAGTDILKIDADGEYSIFKTGEFTPEDFEVGNMNVTVKPEGEKKHYDFELVDISEDFDNLPLWIQQEIMNQKYPYKVHQDIEFTTSFSIEQAVPEEIVSLRSLTLKENAKMSVKVRIYSANHNSDDMLEIINNLYIGEGGNELVINVPEYLLFADNEISPGRIELVDNVVYDKTTQSFEYSSEYELKGLDFSNYKDGYLPVNDGKISLHEELSAAGIVNSDTVFFGYKNVTHIQSVDVEVLFKIDPMEIESVEGVFAPEISAINESVNLELGDNLDFLNDAYVDFNDPRIFVTFTNPVDATLFADAHFVGYDKEGNAIEGSDVKASLAFEGATTNNIFINRYDVKVDGYTTLQVPDLNNLVKTIPDKVDVTVDARMDSCSYSVLELGKSFTLSGNYTVSVPLVFDNIEFVYTERIEDLLGENADDVTDYVKDVEAVTVSFDALNTIPATFIPLITAYDKSGNELTGITVDVVGAIEAGNGMDGASVTEPVKSAIALKLSSLGGELQRLHGLDIELHGEGGGRFNANEYIQLKDIRVTIDEQISVDLN